MSERAKNFLKHYASKYYDPVKAREYYLRTRELKGKQNEGLTKENREKQREATAYVRNEIATRRKADLDANAKVREGLTETRRSQAEAHAARMEKIRTDVEAARAQIMSKLQARLAQNSTELKIPTNASPKLRAFLEKQNASRTEDARKDAQAEMSKLRDDLKGALTKARDEYRASRETLANASRANTEERRKITETYRNDLETEKKNIADKVR